MWTHVSLNCERVWDDVLWRVVAIWQEDDGADPVVMEKSGRGPLGALDGPDAILGAAVAALEGQALEGRREQAGR
jgi:hypothetical protein